MRGGNIIKQINEFIINGDSYFGEGYYIKYDNSLHITDFDHSIFKVFSRLFRSMVIVTNLKLTGPGGFKVSFSGSYFIDEVDYDVIILIKN